MKRVLPKFTIAAGVMYLALWLMADWIWPLRQPALSSTVLAENGQLLRAYLSDDEKWRLPVELDELPNYVVPSLVCLEDRRFWYHPGIDPFGVGRATLQNFRSGQVVSGASTLSMQLMRLFAPRQRNWFNKISEAGQALAFEMVTSKKKVLQLYLTYAPFGGNIEGLASASHHLFGVRPSELSISQTAALWALPQSPRRLHDLNEDQWQKVIERNLRRMKGCGVIDEASYAKAKQEIQIPKQRPLPFIAPHLADTLVTASGQKWQTTIRMATQQYVEAYLARHRRSLNEAGINNVAIAVIENKTGNIEALVGNFGYEAQATSSQMMASFARLRSPGSTLKPFLYAEAIQRGMLLPDMLIEDIPMQFSGYAPENYSGTFSGLVKAEVALSESLNLPFIKILQDMGVEYFASVLAAGGLQQMTKLDQLGLSMIVGGVEVNFLELTQLYLALSNQGEVRPLRMLATEPLAESHRWLHPGAVALTNATLALRDRPDFPSRLNFDPQSKNIHWKTGTSQGRRDAWSIGFHESHTVAVWLGNLNQEPSHNLVGGYAAAPIMFDILASRRLRAKKKPRLSEDFRMRNVCALSGYRPGIACRETKKVATLQHRHPAKTCPFHRRLMIDAASGLRLEPNCAKGKQLAYLNIVDWPPRLAQWLSQAWLASSGIPRFHADCQTSTPVAQSFAIQSPSNGSTYLQLASFGHDDTFIPLKISQVSSERTPRCFLNNTQLPTNANHLQLKAGQYQLFCISPRGESATSQFRIEARSQSEIHQRL